MSRDIGDLILDGFGIILCAGLALMILSVPFIPALAWYQAGLQAAAYHRQGIEASQWEIFMGVDPAVRKNRVEIDK